MGSGSRDIFFGGTSLCVIPVCGAESPSRTSSASPAATPAASKPAASAVKAPARAANAASALTVRRVPARRPEPAAQAPAAASAAPPRPAARRPAAARAAAASAAAIAAEADAPFISRAPFGALTWYLLPASVRRRVFSRFSDRKLNFPYPLAKKRRKAIMMRTLSRFDL